MRRCWLRTYTYVMESYVPRVLSRLCGAESGTSRLMVTLKVIYLFEMTDLFVDQQIPKIPDDARTAFGTLLSFR